MILADTSVWIQHFRKTVPALKGFLEQGLILMHPVIRGELACGSLAARPQTLRYLSALPRAKTATDAEVLQLIEDHKLSGLGIGWIDAHLIASSLLSGCVLWTLDRRLNQAAGSARVKGYTE
jgi:predicted nucleic acid-binding protein